MFPIPYAVTNPTRRLPFMLFCLIAANVAIHFGAVHGGDYIHFHEQLAFKTDEVRLTTLLASEFMHGGWMHLIGNMWFLWLFGANIEDMMGRPGFVAFYLAGGIVATLAFKLAQDLAGAPSVSLVGASGAISAVMGGYFVLFPRSKVKTFFLLLIFPVPFFPIPAWFFLGLYMVMQFVSMRMMEYSNVAYMAHVGGFAFGAGVVYLLTATRAVIVPNFDAVKRGQAALLGPQEAFLGRLEAAYEKKQFGSIPELYRALMDQVPDAMFEPCEQLKVAGAIHAAKEYAMAVEAYRRLMEFFPETPEAHRAGLQSAKIVGGALRSPASERAYLEWVVRAAKGQGPAAEEAKALLAAR